MEFHLKISQYHHDLLKQHLISPDGKESAAVALCGRYNTSTRNELLVHEVIMIPNNECTIRESEILRWSTKRAIPFFEKVSKHNFALLKMHSHPGGYDKFSSVDDNSDQEFFNSVFGWSQTNDPHASAIMLPGGEIICRFFMPDMCPVNIDKVSIIGDEIHSQNNSTILEIDEYHQRTIQAFGEKTYSILKSLKIGVLGCSGTGSPLIEQFIRLGVGRLVIIDPDIVERKNINRIINSSVSDAQSKISKVEMISEAVKRIGLGNTVSPFSTNIFDSPDAIHALIDCDVIFGCVDSVDGRYLLNQLSTFYLKPYFDIGVKLESDGHGGINKICGTVHYIQPGKSSLMSRGVFTIEDLRAASQLRKNPSEFAELAKNKYIKNINVNNPAVISVNMMIASHCVNELLNRIHPYKTAKPNSYAQTTIDMTENCIINVAEEDLVYDSFLRKKVGRGDMKPFLEMSDIAV